jgi:NADPH2:quinone reductase
MDVPEPVPGPDDVLLRVKAIGLNFADVFARMGLYPSVPKPPFIPGLEVAGVVTQVGEKVRGIRKGNRVLGLTRQKAYAEFVAAPSSHVQILPPGMPFEHAAAFGVTYLTAYHALVTLAHLSKGERVLIHAAAGGVGTAAVQIARRIGAEIFASVGSERKMAVAAEQGAQHVVNCRRESFATWARRESQGAGLDVILDSIGGRTSREGLKLLAPMGRLVIFGFAAVTGPSRIKPLTALREIMATPRVNLRNLPLRNISVMGFNLYFLEEKIDYLQKAMRILLRWYQEGSVRPVVGRVFPLREAAEAHAYLQGRHSVGKVLLKVDES